MANNNTADVASVLPPNRALSSMSELPISPTSVASSGHFPFSASEISGIGTETSTLETAFTSDVANSVGLQLPPDGTDGNSRDSFRSLDQIQWNFSLTDLTADLSNLGGNTLLKLHQLCLILGFWLISTYFHYFQLLQI